MYNFLKHYKIPTTLVFTKTDKIGSSKKQQQLHMLKKAFDIVVGDNIVLFSSVSKLGKEEVLNYMERLMEKEND
jgi:probable GTP-binding protein engB